MSKQTAIDVYHAQIRYLIKMGLNLSEPDKTFLNSAYRDCKAMEREQMAESFCEGSKLIECPNELSALFEFELYYLETYKGGEQ